ncbi:unnamed protein product [Knipowitschia caucasica]
MTSRRPMTRSYSGNGRTSSFNEEEGSSSSNGRNTYLSNVRPENRSTLCSVMAQLTEDVQPSFETTLKSKAVSEKCNVKFTCVVSGYPAPELKWYKDDKEMDRYCGLPKYEIHRNGKTHTLHIYDCTLDDAAIYQVSAVNSKGIVSCSGVLEVGTMSEYQIHQRFFAKLKAKAEKKRLDLEGTNKKDTADKVEKEQPQKSPERTPRKRPIPQRQRNVEEPPESAGDKNMQNTVQEPVPPAFPVAPEVKKDGEPSSVNKKIKISNGTDAQTEPPSSPKSSVSSRSGAQGSAAENHYDGGMGLAQFLAETLQSQAAEEKQANKEETVQGVTDSEAKAQEEDGQQKAGEEAMEQDTLQVRERADQEVKDESKEISGSSTPTPTPTRHEARLHHKGPKELKEHKDHHKPASLTSMLHSVKDFFFGKNKKDTHEHRYHSDSPNTPEQTPPSFYLQSEERSNDDNGMSTEVAQLQDPTPERPHVAEKQEDPCRAEMASESPGRVTVGGSADQAMEVTAEGGPLSRPQLRSEAVGKDDRLLNVKSEDSLDASRPPPDPSHAAVEEATVETRPGLEVVGPVLSQRPHTQNRGEDRAERHPPPASKSQPQQNHLMDTCDLSSALEKDKQAQSSVTPLVSDGRGNSQETVAGVQSLKELNANVPRKDNDNKLNTQSLTVTNPESNECTISESVITVQDRELPIPIDNIPVIQISTIDDTQNVEVVFVEKVENNTDFFPASKPLMAGTEQEIKTEFHFTEDIPEIHPVVPVICIEDEILTPTIQISQPDVKEGPSPMALAQEKERMELDNLKNVLIKNDRVSDFCVPKDMEKADGKVEAEEVIQVPYPIPIINVSCTEEGIEQAASDAVALSVLVTPPIPETAEIRDKTEQTRMAEPTESTEHTSAPREIPEPTDNIERREETEHGDAPGHKERTEKDELPAADNASEVAEFRETSKHRGTCENGERPELKDTTEQHVAAVIEDKKTPEHTEPEPTSKDDTKQNSQMPQGELTEQTVGENRLIVANEPAKSDMNVLSKTVEASIENEITQSLKEARIESFMSVERLSFKPPLYPSLSPASLRKFMSKASGEGEGSADRQSDKAEDSLSGGSTPTSSLSCESSPRLKRRDSLSLIRSATPEELASGARRKIFIPKTKEETEDCSNKKDSPYMSPGQARRASFLQPPTGPNTPPVERRSPLLNRRKATLEVPKVVEEIPVPEEVSIKLEDKSGDKKPDPLKAPQVIRKIRGEPFPDASGHLKLWCQFFNVLSDSTIKWYKEEQEILEVQRSGSDESQVALAIVLASSLDCGVYGCTINNEYGTDTTDFLLSEDVMGEILLKDDLEVGEEIEMTPLMFNRGLGDSGTWGGKFFGRIMTETVHLGAGWTHKTSRVKVIYGLEPVFESGASCIMKIQNPIPYGTKLESNLAERNQEITKQECKVQNMIREYCKIFSAEARVNENFGSALEVVSQYLMYRPANSVPYATVEAELPGLFETYCWVDAGGKLNSKGVSEAEQKCSTFQHWLYEWTHSNLLTTRLEGVDFKLTNVRVVTKSKGYQGLSERGSPDVFDQFVTHHQCNYYCGLLGLRPLKTMDSLQPPIKMKGSRSPLLNRKSGGPGSPHVQKKSSLSPHSQRRAGTSPKVPRKNLEAEDSTGKSRAVDTR